MTNEINKPVRFVSAYVKYKGTTYLIADVRGKKLLLIDQVGTKLQVLKTSVQVYPKWRVCEITVNEITYWVTRRANILSTSTYKWIWKSKCKQRTSILNIAKSAWVDKALIEAAQ